METLTTKIEDLKHQLAYSLAAIKIKNEALEQLLDDMGEDGHCVCDAAKLQATEALAIQPDDAALVAWLGEPVARTLKRIGEEQYQPKFGMVARTYAELPKGSYPDTWQELDELYSPKGLK